MIRSKHDEGLIAHSGLLQTSEYQANGIIHGLHHAVVGIQIGPPPCFIPILRIWHFLAGMALAATLLEDLSFILRNLEVWRQGRVMLRIEMRRCLLLHAMQTYIVGVVHRHRQHPGRVALHQFPAQPLVSLPGEKTVRHITVRKRGPVHALQHGDITKSANRWAPVKTFRQVPFPHPGRIVSRLPHQLADIGYLCTWGVIIENDSGFVRHPPGDQGASGWPANRIGTITACKAHPLGGEAIHPWCFHIRVSRTRHCRGRLLIGKDKEDIGARILCTLLNRIVRQLRIQHRATALLAFAQALVIGLQKLLLGFGKIQCLDGLFGYHG